MDDVVAKLRSDHPDWFWKEEPEIEDLCNNPALNEINESGIYNRAVVIPFDKSPYTQGLETELEMLQTVDESEYSNTALGDWLSGHKSDSINESNEPLLEVLPPQAAAPQHRNHQGVERQPPVRRRLRLEG